MDLNPDASRNPPQPFQCQLLAPKGPNIAPTGCQNGTKHLQHRGQVGPRGAKMEPKWGQDGAKTAKKSKNNINPT